MKLFLRSAIAIAAIAAAAPSIAADLSYPVAPVYTAPIAAPAAEPVYDAAYDWSGFYAGVLAGYGWGRAEQNTTGEFDASGYLLGGFAGYNIQAGDLVYGLEADLAWTDTNGTTATRSTDLDWVGTLRGRAGYAFDSILPYVTGGFALADINASDSAPGGFSTDEVQLGLTAGAGVEVGITENISVRAEYSYTDFGGDWDFNNGNGQDLDFSSHAVKTGVAISF